MKNEYVSDCVYEIGGNSRDSVTFICADVDHEHKVFRSYGIYCSNLEDDDYYESMPYKEAGTIDFQNCQFSSIKRNFLSTFYNVHSIVIAGVELETLNGVLLQNAGALTKLDASKNKLTEVPSHVFSNTTKLEYLDLSNNSIVQVHPAAFLGLDQLKVLNLPNNQIHELDPQTLWSMPNLRIFDISANSLKKLNAHMFDKSAKLDRLDMSSNPISNLSNATFTYLLDLSLLNLRQANLSAIEVGTFSHQHKLTGLDLSENNLKTLNFRLFYPVQRDLRSLLLDENQLTDLDGFGNALFPQLNHLGIQGNRFNCSYLKKFMDSVDWKGIRLHLTIGSIDTMIGANKTNIRGISCEEAITVEDNAGRKIVRAQSVQTTGKQTKENIASNSQKSQNDSDESTVIKVSLLFICVVLTVYVILFAVTNRFHIKSLFVNHPADNRRSRSSKTAIVECYHDEEITMT